MLENSTIGSSVQYMRIVTGSPKRSWMRRMNPAGRAIQATVCQAAGARGPGGRSIASAYGAATSLGAVRPR